MKLYIAEKPSLGRAIAEVLSKPQRKGEGCIYLGNGDCVSWCIGHLLEQAEPHAYDPAFKQWQLQHLPIVPEAWQLTPKSGTRKQLAVLRKLVREADELVHAGDPDREGQLLVDEVLQYLKLPAGKREQVQRCLINDLNPEAVRRALGQLRPNRDFVPLATSALARSRADWLYGINLTRAYTLMGRKVGYRGVLSVGRVQTPVLGLVVRRDTEIEQFVPKPFFQVIAHLRSDAGAIFRARWQPSEACRPWQDDEGRVLHRPLAENVVARIGGQPARVTASRRRPKKQPPPLPYNLSSLQIDAARRFGLSAQQVLDTCQALYERHKLITYPRSDCRYLPESHWGDRQQVLAALSHTCDALADATRAADPQRRSKAWNDQRVDAHHAIIPTARKLDGQRLSGSERQVYELVARQYLAQFYPPFEYSDQQIELEIGGGQFVAKARVTLYEGWKQLYPSRNNTQAETTAEGTDPPSNAPLNTHLPELKRGDSCLCEHGEILEKQTTPPKPFDDASLLAAMTGINRYVQDADIRKVLKDTDGLGTEATRAGIIELLFSRGFLQRQGKQIRATDAGRGLVRSLPASATTPDMTALWEMQLEAISQRQGSYQGFMQPLESTLRELVVQSQASLPLSLQGVEAKPAGKGRRRRKGPPRKGAPRKAAVKRKTPKG